MNLSSKMTLEKPRIHTNLSFESHVILNRYSSKESMGVKRWKNRIIDLSLKLLDNMLKEASEDPKAIGHYLTKIERSGILARKLLRDDV